MSLTRSSRVRQSTASSDRQSPTRHRSLLPKAHYDGRYLSKEPIADTVMLHRKMTAIETKKSKSQCEVIMHYYGSHVNLKGNGLVRKQRIIVEQQHNGSGTLIVFNKALKAPCEFRFFSHRHRGHRFALTIYIDGIQSMRLNVCCEYKAPCRGLRLDGLVGPFGVRRIRGGVPCTICRISKEYGKQCKLPWKIAVPDRSRSTEAETEQTMDPIGRITPIVPEISRSTDEETEQTIDPIRRTTPLARTRDDSAEQEQDKGEHDDQAQNYNDSVEQEDGEEEHDDRAGNGDHSGEHEDEKEEHTHHARTRDDSAEPEKDKGEHDDQAQNHNDSAEQEDGEEEHDDRAWTREDSAEQEKDKGEHYDQAGNGDRSREHEDEKEEHTNHVPEGSRSTDEETEQTIDPIRRITTPGNDDDLVEQKDDKEEHNDNGSSQSQDKEPRGISSGNHHPMWNIGNKCLVPYFGNFNYRRPVTHELGTVKSILGNGRVLVETHMSHGCQTFNRALKELLVIWFPGDLIRETQNFVNSPRPFTVPYNQYQDVPKPHFKVNDQCLFPFYKNEKLLYTFGTVCSLADGQCTLRVGIGSTIKRSVDHLLKPGSSLL